MRGFCVGLAVVLSVSVAFGFPIPSEIPTFDYPVSLHEWRWEEAKRLSQRYGAVLADGELEDPRVHQDVDVTRYIARISLDMEGTSLNGEVTIEGSVKSQVVDEIVIDLVQEDKGVLTLNSVSVNGAGADYEWADDKITVALDPPLQPAESFEVVVDYSGVYEGYQGIKFDEHDGVPVVGTLDQPYQTPGWLPCLDVPEDKATGEFIITCPSDMVAVSNGLLQDATDNGDGTITYSWKTDYATATYLFMIAATNYEHFTDTYTSLDGMTEMTLNYYAYPEKLADAQAEFMVTKEMIEFLAGKFGEYPFLSETYGMAMVPFSGALETQTMTSLGDGHVPGDGSAWDVIVHELGHQWWGDMVTMTDWHHTWLSEGFATYTEALWQEHESGTPAAAGSHLAEYFDDGLYDGNLWGTVYVEDVSQMYFFFTENNMIYDKGAWVTHMLRKVLGDSDFFAALQEYGRVYAYSNAVTEDLQAVMETFYGQSLAFFFDQWIYTPYRPVYRYTFDSTKRGKGYVVDVSLYQTQGHKVTDAQGTEKRDYYIMPVDFTLRYGDGTEESFTVLNNHRYQRFRFRTSKEPVSVAFDEDIYILKVVEEDGPPAIGNELPSAAGWAFPRSGKAPLRVFLVGRTADSDGSIAQSNWVIDNKEKVAKTGLFQMYTITQPGTHQFYLEVEDDQGGGATSVPITVSVE